MKIFPLYISLIVLIIIFLPLILSLGIKIVPDGFQPSLGGTQKIYEEQKLFYTFTSKKDNLTGIGVSIKNPQLINKKDLFLNILEDGQILRAVVINGKVIRDGDFVRLLFEPIKNSQRKNYTIVFSSPTSKSNEALEIFLTEDEGGQQIISLVGLYKVDNPFLLAFQIYQQIWQRLIKDRLFFVFYIGIILIISGYLIPSVFNKRL